jgi:hypothetical protein
MSEAKMDAGTGQINMGFIPETSNNCSNVSKQPELQTDPDEAEKGPEEPFKAIDGKTIIFLLKLTSHLIIKLQPFPFDIHLILGFKFVFSKLV